jgi:hypothetical protein
VLVISNNLLNFNVITALSDLSDMVTNLKVNGIKNDGQIVRMPFVVVVTDCMEVTKEKLRGTHVDRYLSSPLSQTDMHSILQNFTALIQIN